MTEAQLASGYAFSNDLREVLLGLIGTAPRLSQPSNPLKASCLTTPLGSMIAIADEQALSLLEFIDYRGLARQVKLLRQKTKSAIVLGETGPIRSIEKELHQYFNGQLTEFQTPLFFSGTPFQQQVWKALKEIPHGETRSYAELAKAIGKPTAFRAVAQANGANRFPIVVPCHRVINKNGDLGGYSSGLPRKVWLINHEKKEKGVNSPVLDVWTTPAA